MFLIKVYCLVQEMTEGSSQRLLSIFVFDKLWLILLIQSIPLFLVDLNITTLFWTWVETQQFLVPKIQFHPNLTLVIFLSCDDKLSRVVINWISEALISKSLQQHRLLLRPVIWNYIWSWFLTQLLVNLVGSVVQHTNIDQLLILLCHDQVQKVLGAEHKHRQEVIE